MKRMLFLFTILITVTLVNAQTEEGTQTMTDEIQLQENQVLLRTNYGDIVLELFPDKAPVSVENFLYYVRSGYYTNTLFHRVIGYFMIQGGTYIKGFQEKETRDPITNEADNGLSNERGTIAYARTQVVNSATSGFFINLVDNTNLDHKNGTQMGFGYAVFGKVVKGMEVVDEIGRVKTHIVEPFADVPIDDVLLLEARAWDSAISNEVSQ